MQKMNIFYKNLKRGLSGGGLDLESRTFPGIAELSFLRLMGFIWSTSDMNHAVISPARVLMGSYLGLCRVRSVKDLASGLFLCTVLLQYESVSKRFVPEAINFLVNAVVHLAPHSYASIASVPGSAAIPDFDSDLCQSLKINPARISKKEQKTERPRQINITSILSRAGDDADEADKLDLLTVAFSLLGRYADFYKGLDGFIEIFEPISQIITSFEVDIVSVSSMKLLVSHSRYSTSSIVADSTDCASVSSPAAGAIRPPVQAAVTLTSAQADRYPLLHPQIRVVLVLVSPSPGSRPRTKRGIEAASPVQAGEEGCYQGAQEGCAILGWSAAAGDSREGSGLQQAYEARARGARVGQGGREERREGEVEGQAESGSQVELSLWMVWYDSALHSSPTFTYINLQKHGSCFQRTTMEFCSLVCSSP